MKISLINKIIVLLNILQQNFRLFLNKNNPKAYYEKGCLLEYLDKYKITIKYLSKAIDLGIINSDLFFRRRICYNFLNGHYNPIESKVKEAISSTTRLPFVFICGIVYAATVIYPLGSSGADRQKSEYKYQMNEFFKESNDSRFINSYDFRQGIYNYRNNMMQTIRNTTYLDM